MGGGKGVAHGHPPTPACKAGRGGRGVAVRAILLKEWCHGLIRTDNPTGFMSYKCSTK